MTYHLPPRRFQRRALRTTPIAAIVMAGAFTTPNAAAQTQATAPAAPTALPTVTAVS